MLGGTAKAISRAGVHIIPTLYIPRRFLLAVTRHGTDDSILLSNHAVRSTLGIPPSFSSSDFGFTGLQVGRDKVSTHAPVGETQRNPTKEPKSYRVLLFAALLP
jgi:hypothetical protein